MSNNLSRSQANVVRLVWMLVTVVLAVMAIFPLLYMLSIAFKGPTEVFKSNLIPAKPVLDNFIYVLTEVPFWRYLLNTFVISAVVTVVALFFHTMAGYALARLKFPGREAVFLAMFSTFLVSLPVIIVPLFILVRSMGMLNSYAGLIVPAIFNAFGIFLLRQYYVSLPREGVARHRVEEQGDDGDRRGDEEAVEQIAAEGCLGEDVEEIVPGRRGGDEVGLEDLDRRLERDRQHPEQREDCHQREDECHEHPGDAHDVELAAIEDHAVSHC